MDSGWVPWVPQVQVMVIRYENLQGELSRALAPFDLDPGTLPVVDPSPGRQGRHWREVFTDEPCS